MLAVILLGVVCLSVSLLNVSLATIDIHLVVLFIFTVAVGSRITIQIPRFRSYISASETFIFLALLLYAGEFAVILAAAEAFATSWRFCKKKVTVLFNTAIMAISTSAVVVALKVAGLYTQNQPQGDNEYRQNFIIALSVIALTQFFVNTSLASVYGPLRDSNPFWRRGRASISGSFSLILSEPLVPVSWCNSGNTRASVLFWPLFRYASSSFCLTGCTSRMLIYRCSRRNRQRSTRAS